MRPKKETQGPELRLRTIGAGDLGDFHSDDVPMGGIPKLGPCRGTVRVAPGMRLVWLNIYT